MLPPLDPGLLLLLASSVIVAATVLHVGRSRRDDARARSIAAHPSAVVRSRRTRGERDDLAAVAADTLAAAGLICTRQTGQPTVRARALDGEYIVNVGTTGVTASYATDHEWLSLGPFRTTQQAVRAVIEHSNLPARY